jgi:hypothetical protein
MPTVSVSLKDRTATLPSQSKGPDFKKERDDYLADFNLDNELLIADSKQDYLPATKRINMAATPTGEPNRA